MALAPEKRLRRWPRAVTVVGGRRRSDGARWASMAAPFFFFLWCFVVKIAPDERVGRVSAFYQVLLVLFSYHAPCWGVTFSLVGNIWGFLPRPYCRYSQRGDPSPSKLDVLNGEILLHSLEGCICKVMVVIVSVLSSFSLKTISSSSERLNTSLEPATFISFLSHKSFLYPHLFFSFTLSLLFVLPSLPPFSLSLSSVFFLLLSDGFELSPTFKLLPLMWMRKS